MAEEATTTTTETAGNGTSTAGSTTTTTFSQEDLDRIVGERLAREREKFGDYDDLKTKASEFDKLAEAQKTEAQKAAEQAQKAEGRATEAELRVMRYEVAAEKGLDLKIAAALAGTTKEELAANADLILGVTGSNNASNFDGGARKTAPTNDMDSRIRQAAGFGG